MTMKKKMTGRNMALGVAAVLPAIAAGAFAWSRLRNHDNDEFSDDEPLVEDPRFVYDG
jgi:hypothetical protein